MKSFPFGVYWHLRVKLPVQGLRLTLQSSDRRVGVVQPVFKDAAGGGVQIGKLLWDLVGVGASSCCHLCLCGRPGDSSDSSVGGDHNTPRKCGHPGPPGMSLQQPRASQAQMVRYSGSHLPRHQPPTPHCAHGPVKGALRQSCLQQKSKLQAMETSSTARQMAACSDTGCQPGRQVRRCWAI